MDQTYTMRVIRFFVLLRKLLIKKGNLSIYQYLNSLPRLKSQWLSMIQFQKIAQYVYSASSQSFQCFQFVDLFNDLKQTDPQVNISKFIKGFQIETNKVQKQIQIRDQQQKLRKQQIRKRSQKIAHFGLKKLGDYIKSINALELFQQCDKDNSASLDANQLNILLISSGIKEFDDKDIRKIIVTLILSYLPQKVLSFDQYVHFFKIPKQKIQNFKQIAHQIKPMQQRARINSNAQKGFNKNEFNPYKNKIAIDVPNIHSMKPCLSPIKKQDDPKKKDLIKPQVKVKPTQNNKNLAILNPSTQSPTKIRKRIAFTENPTTNIVRNKNQQINNINLALIKKQKDPKNEQKNHNNEQKNGKYEQKNVKYEQNKMLFNKVLPQKAFKKAKKPNIQDAIILPSQGVQQKKQVVIKQKQRHFIDAQRLFVKSMQYYRNGLPQSQQLCYLQELQNLLTTKKQHRDLSNPHSSKGNYVGAQTFFKKDYQLFEMAQSVIMRQKSRIGLARQIQPKDIIQGSVGDCYFLSSIASLISIYPEIVAEKFIFNKNQANYYVVKLFLDGYWNYIITDDYFVTQNGKTPIYAKPHGNQIWVMLLQKCWAKIFQSYQAIDSGSSVEGFNALTGAPIDYFSLNTQKDLTKQVIQQKLKQAFKRRYVVSVSGSKYLQSLGEKERQQIGLIANHAYSFLKLIDANGVTLIKIRNPWGSRQWKGSWSFESSKWTQQLRNKYNYNQNSDDGAFYMDLNDFLKYFGSFVICKINSTNVHTSKSFTFRKHKSTYINMKVAQQGRYSISVYQQNERKMKVKYKNYEFSPSRVILMKIDSKGNWSYVDSNQNSKSYNTSINVDLQPGNYVLSVKMDWKFWQSHQACVTSYGPQKVEFQQANRTIAPLFKKEMIQSFSKQYRGKIKDYNQIGAIGSYSQTFMDISKGIGYYMITNPSQKPFTLAYSLEGKGVKVIKPDKLPFEFQLNKNSIFLKGFFISSSGYNYQSSESMSYY